MGGFSTVGVSLPSKFPFWSAIITQTQGSVPVAAGATVNVDIQPPAGETWMVEFGFVIVSPTSASYVEYDDYDGTTARMHVRFCTGGTYGDYYPHLVLERILTNSRYARLTAHNHSGGALNFYYGYSGFKLSQPLWTLKRLNVDLKPFKRPTTLPLPPSIQVLDKFKCEVLGIVPDRPEEYGLAVILEEDTPLAVDPATNFPIERLSAYVQADVLADLIAKFKAKTADPVTTGYYKYIRKWFDEGIDLGISI